LLSSPNLQLKADPSNQDIMLLSTEIQRTNGVIAVIAKYGMSVSRLLFWMSRPSASSKYDGSHAIKV